MSTAQDATPPSPPHPTDHCPLRGSKLDGVTHQDFAPEWHQPLTLQPGEARDQVHRWLTADTLISDVPLEFDPFVPIFVLYWVTQADIRGTWTGTAERRSTYHGIDFEERTKIVTERVSGTVEVMDALVMLRTGIATVQNYNLYDIEWRLNRVFEPCGEATFTYGWLIAPTVEAERGLPAAYIEKVQQAASNPQSRLH